MSPENLEWFFVITTEFTMLETDTNRHILIACFKEISFRFPQKISFPIILVYFTKSTFACIEFIHLPLEVFHRVFGL